MTQTLAKLLAVSRPVSWLNTAFPFAAGYLVTVGTVDALFVIGTVFFLVPYNLLMYGVNDVFDYESDIKNPRKGSLEGAKVAKVFHAVILRACLVAVVPFVAFLLLASSLQAAMTLLAILFFVVAYSAPPLRFKERPFLDSATSSLHFVGPLLYTLSLASWPSQAWPYVLAFFLWGMASHAFGAVQDIVPDRAAGLSSIATYLGAAPTVVFSFVLYLLSALVLLFTDVPFVGLVILVYAFNIRSFLIIKDKNSAQTNVGWKRFIWLNYVVGFVITITIILEVL